MYKQQVIKTGIRRYFGNYVYLTTSGVSVQFYSISKQEGTCSVGVFWIYSRFTDNILKTNSILRTVMSSVSHSTVVFWIWSDGSIAWFNSPVLSRLYKIINVVIALSRRRLRSRRATLLGVFSLRLPSLAITRGGFWKKNKHPFSFNFWFEIFVFRAPLLHY